MLNGYVDFSFDIFSMRVNVVSVVGNVGKLKMI